MAAAKLSLKPSATGLNFSFDQDDAVTLLVGPSERAILAHGNYLARKSDFCEAALKMDWKEGQTRAIKLPDECPQFLTHYLNYAYIQTLPTSIFAISITWTIHGGCGCYIRDVQEISPSFYSQRTTTKLRTYASSTMTQPNAMSLVVEKSPLNPQFGFTTTRNDTFTLLVGPKRVPVFVPREHLIRSSTLIRHALKTHRIGTHTGAIRLPRENVESFSQYLRFIYSDKLPTEDHTPSEPMIWEKSSAESYTLLAKLYVVGERMTDRHIQDAVMKELVRLSRIRLADGSYRFPGDNVAMDIYQGTTSNDPARRLLVDMYASFASEQWLNSPWIHPTFSLDLVRALLRHVNTHAETKRFRHLDLNVADYLFSNQANAEARLFQTRISDFYAKRPAITPDQQMDVSKGTQQPH